MDRATIHAMLKGTHDIARAAEMLADGGDITYWQAKTDGAKPKDEGFAHGRQFEGMGDSLRDANFMNCFEFVHLCNVMSCCNDNPGNQGMSNLETQLFDVRAGFNEWDGTSPIPRGSVVVGTTPVFGSGSKGVYHVGVAVGDGRVVSNRNGQNVTKEPVGDVFGSSFYKVYYGPYPHCRCHETSEDHQHVHDYPVPTTGPMHELPSVGRQNVQRAVAAVGTATILVLAGGFVALGGLFGSTPAEPTPLPTLARGSATPSPSDPPTPTPSPTPSPRLSGPLLVDPLKAVFTQARFSTTYSTTVTPSSNAFTYHWAGPNCGTWGSTDETSVAAQNDPVPLVFTWSHPHPPCAATTDHSDVTVTLTITWASRTLICSFTGSETNTGPACRPL